MPRRLRRARRIASVHLYAQKRRQLNHDIAKFCTIFATGELVERSQPKDVTTLLLEWSDGNRQALNELMPLVYGQLRQLAAHQIRRERPNHTLHGTALVHEAYLKLIDQRRVQWKNREHFFAVASQVIRRILVTYARSRNASKRGGGATLLAFDESIALPERKDVDLVALDDALETLSQLDPQQGRIIELRFFGGLSIESTARVLGISTSTVTRDWNLARAWLHREVSRSSDYGA
jgi:RNA polymerase sigma factor (TIGR02999 family)